MMRRRTRTAVIAVTTTLVLLLVGCSSFAGPMGRLAVAGDALEEEEPGINTVESYALSLLAHYATSEVLSALGVTSDPATSEQFNELEAQLTGISTQLQTLVDGEDAILFSINEMETYLEQQQLGSLELSFANMQNSSQSAYNQFTAAVQDGTGGPFFTAQQIATSPTIQQELATAFNCGVPPYSCSNVMAQINTDALNMVGETAANPSGGNVIRSANYANYLFEAIQTLALQDMPAAGTTSDFNLSQQLTSSNESITAYMTQVAILLQQSYNIQSIMLYLKYCANTSSSQCDTASATPSPTPSSNPWADIDLAYSGFNDNNTALQNATNLTNTYSQMFTQLNEIATAYLISDNIADPAQSSGLAPAKTLPGVSGGQWVNSCNLYVWSGSNPTGQSFDGTWTGNSLGAQCYQGSNQIPTAPIVMTQTCGDGDANLGVTTAATSSGQVAALQCPSYIAGGGPAWSNGIIGSQNTAYTWFASADETAEQYFNLPGAASPQLNSSNAGPSKTDWQGIGGNNQQWVKTAHITYPTSVGPNDTLGGFNLMYQMSLPNGYLGPLFITGSGAGNFHIGWNYAVGCSASDVMCGPNAGSGGGGNGICLAGYPITIAMTSSDGNTANVSVGSQGACTVNGVSGATGTTGPKRTKSPKHRPGGP